MRGATGSSAASSEMKNKTRSKLASSREPAERFLRPRGVCPALSKHALDTFSCEAPSAPPTMAKGCTCGNARFHFGIS